MPSKTTNSLQRAPQAAGYNLKGRNIQAPLKSSPFDVKAINSSSSLDDHPRYINENDRFMHYSVRDFKARQNNTLSASSQAALYSRGSALIEATATAEVAAYICRPCDGPGSDGGTRFDNYNSAFPPIQGTSVSSHKGGDSTRGRRTSSDGGERPPPPTSPSGHVTPQNLRDNPERLAKVKTEMCAFYERGGAKNCPYGANCEYCVIFVMCSKFEVYHAGYISSVRLAYFITTCHLSFCIYYFHRQLRPRKRRTQVPLHHLASDGKFRSNRKCQHIPCKALHDVGNDRSVVSIWV